jgi:4-hydroxy-tetrahydrodipicolinate synthase
MTQQFLNGVFPALVTPFRNGAIDEKAFAELVERQIAGGVHGLVPVGTTGESATLSHEEHRRVVELCVQVAGGRVPVIAGAGSNSTAEAIDFTRHAKAVGAAAALLVTPYYNRPSQEGLYRHYAAINDAVDITNETLERLAKLPHVAGIKDATGDMSRVSLQRLMCGENWVMLSGDDPTALGYMAHGGHGVISVTVNVAPEACVAFYEAWKAGDLPGALAWQDRLVRLHKALFLDASPAPTKFALARLGLCSEEARLPITPCSDSVKPTILAAMAAAGVPV